MHSVGKVLQIATAGTESPRLVLSRLRELMATFESAYLSEACRWIDGLADVLGTNAKIPVVNSAVAATVVALPVGGELLWALPHDAAKEVMEVLWRSRMAEPMRGKIQRIEVLDAMIWQAHFFELMIPFLGMTELTTAKFQKWLDFGPNGLRLSAISLEQAKKLIKWHRENPSHHWAAAGRKIVTEDRKIRAGQSPLLPGLN